ncbi:MAG: hypothetical protein ACUVUG_07665 [Candidatus Aminicenantia bacterium]
MKAKRTRGDWSNIVRIISTQDLVKRARKIIYLKKGSKLIKEAGEIYYALR